VTDATRLPRSVQGSDDTSDHDRYDVLAAGIVAVDEVLVVAEYPQPDRKVYVLERRRGCGGNAATALVAAARLGARCAYAGTLGRDDLSEFILERLTDEHVDVQHVTRRSDARPIHSIIVADRTSGSRTIFFDASEFVGPDGLSASLIRRTQVLLVDHMRIEGALRLARIARDTNVPIVADLEGGADQLGFAELLKLVDHLVLSYDFASELAGATHPADAANALWTADREAVVVTCGAEGSWYRGRSGGVHHCPAFTVVVRDTTGCGDVFHGAYAAALSRGIQLPERLRLASAAAALAANTLGGTEGAPDSDMVAALIERNGSAAPATQSHG
jgi:sulfofructose kinase